MDGTWTTAAPIPDNIRVDNRPTLVEGQDLRHLGSLKIGPGTTLKVFKV